MFGEKQVLIGAGRYFQYHGALKRLGKEVSAYGKRVFILYSDDTVKGKTAERINESINECGLESKSLVFEEPSSGESFQKIAGMLKQYRADAVVGVGGGRILDIAKAAGDLAGIRVFTAPTSAATCAAYAIFFVEYGESGGITRGGFMNNEIAGVLADLDYILDDCPVRYFVSGIADAMSKHPESVFTSLYLGEEGDIPPVASSRRLAEYTYHKYLSEGLAAVEAFQKKEDSKLPEEFVNLNIMMTGLISNMSVGGKSLALAHNFYDAICCKHHDIRARFLHGELVGMSLPMQLYVNGCPDEEIRGLQRFFRSLHVPTTFEEIVFPKEESALEEIVDYIYDGTAYESDELKKKIREGMEYLR